MTLSHAALATLLAAAALGAPSTPARDREIVAALDTEYQAAVERNDAETMGRILADDMILVVGRGDVYTRENLLHAAREHTFTFEHQVEDAGTQTVRLWGDTAVVTARLWLKGQGPQGAFDRRLWFSDTYVRTPQGWRYAFGQSSIQLPTP